MPFTVFYAWQSDRDPDTCRYFIRDAARSAIKQVTADAKVKSAPAIDHATKGETGMVHIAETIKKKIKLCGVFLADLTFVGTYHTHGLKGRRRRKRATNANVGIELGYAMRVKHPKQFVLVMNTQHGPPEDLPFDLKHYSYPIQYALADDTHRTDPAFKAAQQKLTKDIADVLRAIIKANVIGQMGKRAKEQREAEDHQLTQRVGERWEAFERKFQSGGFRGIGEPDLAILLDAGSPHRPREAFIAMSIIPRRAQQPLDMRAVDRRNHHGLKPMGSGSYNTDVFSNVLVNHNGIRDRVGRRAEPPTTAVEIHEDGSVFAVSDMGVGGPSHDKPIIVLEGPERTLFLSLTGYVSVLREFGIVGPLEVRITLRGMDGVLIYPDRHSNWDTRSFRPLTEDTIHLRPVVLDEGQNEGAIVDAMRSAFDRVWMDGGVAHDPCFERDGKYKGQ
jgi:hypothetical protein